jgi:hypothetical protein
MKQKQIIISTIIVVVVAGAAFFGGMEYQKSQGRGAFTQNGQRGQFAAGMNSASRGGANAAFGSIISKDANSITVSTMGGGSKIILFGATTSIGKVASGTPADLVVGENVTANGTANSDGSITATSIQIRPAGMIQRPQ